MAAMLTFSNWLSKKLQSLDTDHDVFGNYIVGILTSEETEVEKRDAVEGVLCGVINKDISELCNEIFKEWSSVQGASNLEDKNMKDGKTDVGAKIAVIMEKQAQSVVKESLVTAEEKEMRDAILAHYSHVSDEDDYCSDKDDEKGVAANTVSNSTITKNVNSEAVAQAEKEKREKAKAESEKKKAQDKLNREKQKQQQQERKEKEKRRTQKGERKR